MIKKLTILDRVVLPVILKPEGNYNYLSVRNKLISKIIITNEEAEKYGIKIVEKQLSWDEKYNDIIFDIEFDENEIEIVKSLLTTLDSEEKLTNEIYMLFEKFVLNKE
jgi:hypothetical protein